MFWIVIIVIAFLICIIVFSRQFSKFILSTNGWKEPPLRLIEIMQTYKKLVIVYPHTSHYDAILLVLYMKAYPEFLSHIKFLMTPATTSRPIIGDYMKSLGAMESTYREIKNGGKTKEIVRCLNEQPHFQFLLSPKGTRDKKEWKTGYYYITKGTGAHIMAVGLNYVTGEVEFNEPYPVPGDSPNFPTEEYLRTYLQSQLRGIPQRNEYLVEY